VITGDQATRAPTGRGRRRAARPAWLRRVLMFSGVALLLVATAFGGEWVLTPSVGDAPQRVHAFAVDHRSTELSGPVPPKYAAALVATEDSRFYSHHGIDSLGVARAALGFLGKPDQGGSTLDQQLAKTLYSNGQRSPTDIAAPVVLGVKLDAAYSKAQILAMYAQIAYFGNGFYGLHDAAYSKAQILAMYAQIAYFGNGFYGLHDAACGYFNTAPVDLSWSQASLLAGLPQAPSDYDPLTAPDLAALRQHHVLDRLVATGVLTRTYADHITPDSLHLSTANSTSAPGCGS